MKETIVVLVRAFLAIIMIILFLYPGAAALLWSLNGTIVDGRPEVVQPTFKPQATCRDPASNHKEGPGKHKESASKDNAPASNVDQSAAKCIEGALNLQGSDIQGVGFEQFLGKMQGGGEGTFF